MPTAVETLNDWFSKLSDTDKRQVVTFLYEGKVLLQKGMYFGPSPNLVTRGLYVGPAPAASTNVCSQCGRPL